MMTRPVCETHDTSPSLSLSSAGLLTCLGEISVEQFLEGYWQQQPLLVRNAFPGFITPVTPDELVSMACDTDASRLVLEQGGQEPWEVRHGPLLERDFTELPDSHWSLLVNDTEQLKPDLEQIIAPFRFIPDWRIDDLMISYAVDGGSVGPHVDAYDVFLLQGAGERRWQISTQPVDDDNFIPDIDLRVLAHFEPEYDWILKPGDMLYLPPGVAHYGAAIGECMTYSIGFRAPSQADLLEDLLGELLENPVLQQRFADPGRTLQHDPTKLSTQDLERLTDFVMEVLPDRPAVKAWLTEAYSS
ncbi:MAG: cupin domain-containing protein [Thiolinea sp.]